ncbi:PfkB family carbohydrate kinase [Alteromonas sp. H39]|uniref:PfkB family carbohydrate kinase n=1 Tax=Alteromonas sp. H39 TaxID=3389876 RepID=UPI0039DF8070
MEFEVVGGVYQEYCSWPNHEVVLGSAGRAAYCLSLLDRHMEIKLHSRMSESDREQLISSFVFLNNCKFQFYDCDTTVKFDYFHPLAEPRIIPTQKYDDLPIFEPKISNDCATIVFGMIEACPKIDTDIAVYDPQNTHNPLLFSQVGSAHKRLAYVANQGELAIFYKREHRQVASTEEMAKWLSEKESAEVVVIKCGKKGAYVYSVNEQGWVNAYKTKSVFPIGSGDSYVAAFSYYWLKQCDSPLVAADKASIATAYYVTHKTMADVSNLLTFAKGLTQYEFKVDAPNVYLAGPFFTLSELWMVNETKYFLESFGLDVFSPYHAVGMGSADEVVQKDIDAIKECDVIFAIFDGNDPGTLFEIGYARSINVPVIILAQNPKDEELKMYEGTGCKIFDDFASAIYNVAWSTKL